VDVNSSANTLAFYDITIISALKGSIVQAPGANLVKILWSKLTLLVSFTILVQQEK
jgi:hypothetical protein